jgi:aspartate racemase
MARDVAMRTIGIIGGMSPESTTLYYRLLNEATKAQRGGLHNARSVILSVDFAEVLALAEGSRWRDVAALLIDAARSVEAAGADVLLLAANTPHIVADDVAAALDIPFLHIADAVAEAVKAAGLRNVGLLGTRFTLEAPFYVTRLRERHGLEVFVPDADARSDLHAIITRELAAGECRDSSRERCRRIIGDLHAAGAQGIALACTELPLLLGPQDSPLPLFDSTRLHVESAVRFALAQPSPADARIDPDPALTPS